VVSTELEPVLWLMLVAFWGVGDAVTTYVAVTRYGGVEKNPVPRKVFNAFGVWSMFPLKLLGLTVIYVSWLSLEGHTAMRVLALASVAALGFVVTAWNVRQVWRVASCEREKEPT